MSFIIVGASLAVVAGGAKLGMALSGRRKRIEEQEDAKDEKRLEVSKRRRALRRAQRINERLTKDEDQDPSL